MLNFAVRIKLNGRDQGLLRYFEYTERQLYALFMVHSLIVNSIPQPHEEI